MFLTRKNGLKIQNAPSIYLYFLFKINLFDEGKGKMDFSGVKEINNTIQSSKVDQIFPYKDAKSHKSSGSDNVNPLRKVGFDVQDKKLDYEEMLHDSP